MEGFQSYLGVKRAGYWLDVNDEEEEMAFCMRKLGDIRGMGLGFGDQDYDEFISVILSC